MPYEYTLRRMVEFAETDMAGIMHFSNYFRFMEATEHAFFRAQGLSVHTHDADHMQGWARVHAECDYAEPLRYQDVVDVQLLVCAKTSKSIGYDFLFRRADDAARIVARGRVTVVCVERGPGETALRSAPIPPAIANCIEVAPPALIERSRAHAD